MLELRGEIAIATSNAPARAVANARRVKPAALWETVVRKEILPHLLHVHARGQVPVPGSCAPSEILARALIDEDEGAARDAFARLSVTSGDEVEMLQNVFAPAARRLQDWWQNDACDFFTVSQAIARLRTLLVDLAAPVGDEALAPAMLMATPPGETHRFGAEMAADLFRREGWRVERADGDLRMLRYGRFDAVAVSCGCEFAAASLPAFIARIRALTRTSRVPIVLGGALFQGPPARGQSLGVDFVGSTPDSFRCFSRHLLRPHHV